MSKIRTSSFLRRALALDAIASSATGALAIFGANALEPLLGLPASFLTAAGFLLIPFVMFIAWLSRQHETASAMIWLAIGANLVWVADSFFVLAARWYEPTALGAAFITAQALAVLAFAALQWIGLKRSAPAMA